MKKKKIVGLSAVAASAIILMIVFVPGQLMQEPSDELQAWNVYRGTWNGYHVHIDETLRGMNSTCTVHLDPIHGYDEPHPKPFAISGYDYTGEGRFDKIAIRMHSVDGCNFVIFTGTGKRIWKPCPSDEENFQPFTDAEIANAQGMMFLAMAEIHNRGNLVSDLASRGENG